MEVKVTLGFDEKAESLLNSLVKVLGASSKVEIANPKKVEEVSDVEMVSQKEEVEEDTDINFSALRKEIKKLGIKLVQAKKQKEVKDLTSKYGYAKMDELPDDRLIQYLEDLKEL